MRLLLLPAAMALLAGPLLATPATADEGCDPAVMHFYKADGLSTTRAGWSKLADMCWQAADSNNDGMIDKEEWDNHHSSLFDFLDSDNDDTTSVDEIKHLQQSD